MVARKSYQQQMSVDIAGEAVVLHIRAMRRKSLRLGVNEQGEIDLRIPLGCAKAEVLAFVNANQEWLRQQRQALLQRQQQHLQCYTLLGNELAVRVSALDEFLVSEQCIWIPAHWGPSELREQMDRWLRPQAKSQFQQLIDLWWPLFQSFATQKPVLRVKKMRTRWGSLSQRGYINLNLALMQLPLELIELVVVHELCHLRHFDHGPGFKALMSDVLPDWRAREQELQARSALVL